MHPPDEWSLLTQEYYPVLNGYGQFLYLINCMRHAVNCHGGSASAHFAVWQTISFAPYPHTTRASPWCSRKLSFGP